MTIFGDLPVGFGGAPLGNLYRAVSDEGAHGTLSAAWAAGIRYFDTAPHYGLGLSERRLGEFLSEHRRDEYRLSTKVGRALRPLAPPHGSDLVNGFDVPASHERVFDPSPEGIRRSLEESLERLRTDHVDIAFLHDPDVYDLSEGITRGLPALRLLRDEGLTHAIGIGTQSIEAALRAVHEGVDAVMLSGRLNLLDRSALDEIVPLCLETDTTFIPVGIFASGVLARSMPTAADTYLYAPIEPEMLATAQGLARAAIDAGTTLASLALLYPLRLAGIDGVTIGLGSAGHVEDTIALLSAAPPERMWGELGIDALSDPRTPRARRP